MRTPPIRFEMLSHPLEEWDVAEKRRPVSQFSAPYTDTLKLLGTEMRMVRASDVRVLVVGAPGSTRQDGMLYANTRLAHPGVSVRFDHPNRDLGTLQFSGDKFKDWHDNLRGIVLHIQSMRAAARWGVNDGKREYTGYRVLEAGTSRSTLGDAAALLAAQSRMPVVQGDRNSIIAAYRRATKSAHPDVGGDPKLWQGIADAKDLLLGNC